MSSVSKISDEESANFELKVTEIGNIIKELSSLEGEGLQTALRKADIYLKEKDVSLSNGSNFSVVQNKTVINQKAFDAMNAHINNAPFNMSKEMFMAQIEADSKKRAEDRRFRSQEADTFKMRANKAFRENNFETALHLYNQAIDCTKESPLLFTNRALTYLHLQLYPRVIKDCDWALKLDENNLKALLYKGRALIQQNQKAEASRCFEEAKRRHSNKTKFIEEYENEQYK